MAELTYRAAVSRGIAQEMARDERVLMIGEDIAAAGGVFKTTEGLLEQFGPGRIRDTPISEEAIMGMVMGAAMTGLRPIGEIMFSDFLATCWDLVANQMAKTRYMTDGQVSIPCVVFTNNGGGLRFGAQHSQSVENWAMAIPGLKVVAPSTAADAKGLIAAAIRDPNPVLFMEHKHLYRRAKGVVREGRYETPLGKARLAREGEDLTVITYGAMVLTALEATEDLDGASIEVLDLRSLYPYDRDAVLASVHKTSKVVLVQEATRSCGVAAEIAALIAEEAFEDLDGPVVRVTTPDVPIPFSPPLERAVLPQVDHVKEACRELLAY